MDEVWIPVPSHEDYMVSSRGRVKSSRGKIMNGKISRGYRQITFATQGHKYETVNLHRLIAELFIPNPDSLPQVNHLNEDKLDNRVENLEWCTRSQNINWTAKRHKASAKPHRPIFVVSPSGHLTGLRTKPLQPSLLVQPNVACGAAFTGNSVTLRDSLLFTLIRDYDVKALFNPAKHSFAMPKHSFYMAKHSFYMEKHSFHTPKHSFSTAKHSFAYYLR